MKEAYEAEFAAIIERGEKQIILARHGRRLLRLLDDTPVVPGDSRPPYNSTAQARQILNDAEDDLRDWRPETAETGDGASGAVAENYAQNGSKRFRHSTGSESSGAFGEKADDKAKGALVDKGQQDSLTGPGE